MSLAPFQSQVLVSDVRGGETLKHFRFQPGDVVVADRGYAQAQGMQTASQQGADLIVRLNPFTCGPHHADGAASWRSAAALQGQQSGNGPDLTRGPGLGRWPTRSAGLGACLSLKLGAPPIGTPPEMSA